MTTGYEYSRGSPLRKGIGFQGRVGFDPPVGSTVARNSNSFGKRITQAFVTSRETQLAACWKTREPRYPSHGSVGAAWMLALPAHAAPTELSGCSVKFYKHAAPTALKWVFQQAVSAAAGVGAG